MLIDNACARTLRATNFDFYPSLNQTTATTINWSRCCCIGHSIKVGAQTVPIVYEL